MTVPVVMAVDGGNSKTHLVLARADGDVLAVTRGPLSSPHHLGLEGSLEVLERLLEEATEAAGIERRNGPVADLASLLMAGVDFPAEEQELREAVERRRWAARTYVDNDTFAVLRAGTERRWGIAVVCGAGINCVGVSPDGRHARFPALGPITGDWGGGYDVGLAALSAAARSEDGRGPRTSLESAVPAHFGLDAPHELAEAIHRRRIALQRVSELAPVVFDHADTDTAAGEIVDRLAAEVVALARVAIERLDLGEQPVEVVLGGGLLQAGNRRLLAGVEAGLADIGPGITVRVASAPPIVGAALLALDDLSAPPEAHERLRRNLQAAVEEVDRRSWSNG